MWTVSFLFSNDTETTNDTTKKEEKVPYYVGAHVSSGGGAYNAIENASLIGATAFALFLKLYSNFFVM